MDCDFEFQRGDVWYPQGVVRHGHWIPFRPGTPVPDGVDAEVPEPLNQIIALSVESFSRERRYDGCTEDVLLTFSDGTQLDVTAVSDYGGPYLYVRVIEPEEAQNG